MDERLAVIHIKAGFFNISLICAHAPMEEKDDATKDFFYDRLERSYESFHRHGIKIVLAGFYARVGKEGICGPAVRKFSLRNETSGNGQKQVDFAGARNMVVCSTRFQYKKTQEAT